MVVFNSNPFPKAQCAASPKGEGLKPSAKPPVGKAAFTLIELLVVVAIIAVLVALLLPALNNARAQTKTVLCQERLKNWGTGYRFYSMDNNDWISFFSNINDWTRCWYYYYPMNNYFGVKTTKSDDAFMKEVNRCPGSGDNTPNNWLQYGLNAELFMLGQDTQNYCYKADHLKRAAYVMTDTQFWIGHGDPYGYRERQEHMGKGNYLFPDTHIETLSVPIGIPLKIRNILQKGSWFEFPD
jgi:prepilin-type N-terminal cleavage/methylation domain-containing protein